MSQKGILLFVHSWHAAILLDYVLFLYVYNLTPASVQVAAFTVRCAVAVSASASVSRPLFVTVHYSRTPPSALHFVFTGDAVARALSS